MATPADYSMTPEDLITEVRELADIEDLTTRHSDAMMLRFFNRSMRRFRTKVTTADFDYFLEPTTPAALPTSAPISSEQFLEVDIPAGAVSIHGVDVLNGGTTWEPLERVSFASRRDYQSGAGRYARVKPSAFSIRKVPSENDAALSAGKLMLFPLDTRGQNYRIWYLPSWVDIAIANWDTYLVYGHDCWFEWIMRDMCSRVYQRDNDSAGAAAENAREKDMAWKEVVKSIRNMGASGPTRVRLRRGSRRSWLRP